MTQHFRNIFSLQAGFLNSIEYLLKCVCLKTSLLTKHFKRLKVKVTQLCLTPCDPMDYSLPGSSVHWIFQAWILEWVAIPFSRGSSQSRDLPNPGLGLDLPNLLHWRQILYQLSYRESLTKHLHVFKHSLIISINMPQAVSGNRFAFGRDMTSLSITQSLVLKCQANFLGPLACSEVNICLGIKYACSGEFTDKLLISEETIIHGIIFQVVKL